MATKLFMMRLPAGMLSSRKLTFDTSAKFKNTPIALRDRTPYIALVIAPSREATGPTANPTNESTV